VRNPRKPLDQRHAGNTPYYPMTVLNGYLTASPNVHAPTTTLDTSPIQFRRFVNASGKQDVQISNGLNRRNGMGQMGIPGFPGYLYAAVPIIPGQMRDNRGGFLKKGLSPSQYQRLWQQGPGSQPQNSGGVGQMLGQALANPNAWGG
jgi:hypothetical protein